MPVSIIRDSRKKKGAVWGTILSEFSYQNLLVNDKETPHGGSRLCQQTAILGKNDTLKAAVIHPGRDTGNGFYLFKTKYKSPPSSRKFTLYIM